ncbi:MAG: metallophosphoesterase [Chitinophagales bacterium]|nr:metallophosphoesterase [Bacteroidota bacterium]MCB9043861.1 metallophosphoesterase [Chitinophagales bacterium]
MIFMIAILLALDIYAFQAIRTATQDWSPSARMGITILYFSVTVFYFIIALLIENGSVTRETYWFRKYIAPLWVVLTFPKIIIAVFLLSEDAVRIVRWIGRLFTNPAPSTTTAQNAISRSVFLSRLGIAVAALPAISLLYGAVMNTYNYQLKKVKLSLPNLPESFKKWKIIQISDIHIGSLTDQKAVQRGIDMINKENADLVLFTGDLVNTQAQEMDEWKEIFSQIKAKKGVFSILGNHDYGDYVRWSSVEAKKANFQQLVDTHKQMGWRLLRNEHQVFEENGKTLALIGVENWSNKAHFPRYGNLKAACDGCEADCKILLSHDPSHWEAEVLNYPDIALTLSGHTHGMQFGINWGSFKWSPIQYVYKQWAGLYQQKQQQIYVNTGFGVLGFPGRVGFLPEITVFTFDS